MIKTLLPSIDPNIYIGNLDEPQYVTSKQPNAGIIYLDSHDAKPYGVNRADCQIGSNDPLLQSINRVRILGFTFNWYIPNVNPRNNTLTFWSSITTQMHTVILDERYYDASIPADVTALVNGILARLNAISGVSGITFSSSVNGVGPRTFNIIATAPFYWDDCDALIKGAQMFGFQREGRVPIPAASKMLGPMNFMYTQYVDIKSNALTKWQKIRSVASNGNNPLVGRFYVGGQAWGPNFMSLQNTYIAFAWNSVEPIYSIDIQIYDEHGDKLYGLNDGKDLEWQFTISGEL
jgi:hypothetical protein